MTEYTPEQVDNLIGAINRLADVREQSQPAAAKADGGRYAAALDGSKAVADALAENDEAKERKASADNRAEMKDVFRELLKETRSPSLIGAIGPGKASSPETRRVESAFLDAHPMFKAAFRDYRPGEFLSYLGAVKNIGDGIDVERAMWGKAGLADLGIIHADAPEKSQSYSFVDGEGKATTGATGATGGYVLPNNLVDTLLKPATQKAVLQNLVTVVNGVAVRGVDQPFRSGKPTRMTFQDWNTVKENVDETYGSYTATLGTIARVMDITKQYARFSAGAAERDVTDELTRAAILAENYYMVAGAGTGSVGSGDPTLGVYTALNARPGFKAAFSSASVTTVAGSFASACATLMQNVAGNAREVTAIVVDHTTFFTALREGSDTAGFWVDPSGGPTGFTRTASGGLAFWGVPIYYDINLGTNATTKIAIGAQWDQFKLYRGMEFRIDSSDVAGTRWDYNLIGFRGEEEIGFHAGSAVEVGAGFLLTSVIP